MRKYLGYVGASFLGSAIAVVFMLSVKHEQSETLLEIERLRAQHNQESNHLTGFATNANSMDLTVAAEKSVNAVVHVKTTFELDGGYYTFDPIRQFFFGDGMYQKAPRIGAGAGSGVIISEDGYIVTNNHVIDKASKIEVVLNNNKSFQATIIGQDPSSDLALLKVDGKDLPRILYGNSDQVKVGEWVLAVGNPFNLESTVTAGIISATGRDINILANGPNGSSAVESFIQTDAAVNPGNSGGALVNANGELIGINAAIKSNTGSYAGYSFAIPVNIVTKVVEDLLKYGAVQRGFLGVSIRNLDQETADDQNFPNLKGVYVADAIDKGAASIAGIKAGDIIVKIAEKEIKNVTELQERISQFSPGDKVLVTLSRKGDVIDIPLVLRNEFGEAEVNHKTRLELDQALGATFDSPSRENLDKLDIEHGVQVQNLISGKLKSAGIQEGFIITKVDDEIIKSEAQLKNVLESKTGGVLIEGKYPNGKRAFYGFGL
jgi:serine protease Do